MKTRTLSLLAGASAPLILSATTQAAFVGIDVRTKPNEFGIFVCNVYATFDNPGDLFSAAAGTADSPLDIQIIEGTFYQHAFGTDRAPLASLVAAFPELAYDTFVTIGIKKVGDPGGQPPDNLVLTPGWPGFGDSKLFLNNAGWAVTPNEPQGDPFNPNYVNGDGRILIGQFSTADGNGISGTMLLQYFEQGVPAQSIVSFEHLIPTPGALGLLGIAGLFGVRRRRRA